VDAFSVVLESGDLVAETIEPIHVSAVVQQLQVFLLQDVESHLLYTVI